MKYRQRIPNPKSHQVMNQEQLQAIYEEAVLAILEEMIEELSQADCLA